jgi:hypothetical protein
MSAHTNAMSDSTSTSSSSTAIPVMVDPLCLRAVSPYFRTSPPRDTTSTSTNTRLMQSDLPLYELTKATSKMTLHSPTQSIGGSEATTPEFKSRSDSTQTTPPSMTESDAYRSSEIGRQMGGAQRGDAHMPEQKKMGLFDLVDEDREGPPTELFRSPVALTSFHNPIASTSRSSSSSDLDLNHPDPVIRALTSTIQAQVIQLQQQHNIAADPRLHTTTLQRDLRLPNSFNAVTIARCRPAYGEIDHFPTQPIALVRPIRTIPSGGVIVLLQDQFTGQAKIMQCVCGKHICEYRIHCACLQGATCQWPLELHKPNRYAPVVFDFE